MKRTRTRTRSKTKSNKKKNWSKYVTIYSNAMDLEEGVFTLTNPLEIAKSLKRSSDSSKRLKSKNPYKSAMAMLTFYINRAGSKLSPERKKILEKAKIYLRILYNK